MSDLFQSIQVAIADRYQLERELGHGGMATVYLGRELKHGRDVAIKVLRPELAGVMTRGRFLREIRISASLTHPHILPLLDSGSVQPDNSGQTLPFYTMPFVDGESLRDRLRRERELSLEDAVGIAKDVAGALDYAHAHGVIHRDIKPENILLTGGQALVADFGIARALKEAVDPEAATSAGMIIGTAAYMSPQQAAGEADLDGRTDLYSLACVVYEMLGGEPPFTGASPQAILARHRLDAVPTLRTLRPAVPESIERAIQRALEKSPGDRFATAGKFVEALEGGSTGETVRLAAPQRHRHRMVIGLLVLLAAVGAWWGISRSGPVANPNRVVVFPLGETRTGPDDSGDGVIVALMIGTALEYTNPLAWIDGLPLLDPSTHHDVGQLTTAKARRIAKAAGARWYLDGTVVHQADSVTVVLRLNDATGDSVVGRASATRLAPDAAQAGLEAVNLLLPKLLAPGQQMADLSALADRRPAAVASWLEGERAYRAFDFETALTFERRAVAQDSALAVAAIRGAQAASWLGEPDEARELAAVAVQNARLLPGRTAPFAHGLLAYQDGQADSAVIWLRKAIQLSPDWTEAHMSLGEVYYHLIPLGIESPDSMAQQEFLAAAADSGFAPARLHLAEIAIRSGDTARAKRAVSEFARVARAQSSKEDQTALGWMLGCMTHGRAAIDWQTQARTTPMVVLRAAANLAGGGALLGCAEDAYRAVFDDSAATLVYRWGGFVGLQGVLAAERRTPEVRSLVDSAIARGLGDADQLYVLDALAGLDVVPEAAGVVRRDSVAGFETLRTFMIWLAGEWHAQAGDSNGIERARDALRVVIGRGAPPESPWYAEALEARRLLIRGDTLGSINRFRYVLTNAPQRRLAWSLSDPLQSDRLVYAELLLARGQAAEAIAVASAFDLAEVANFVPFLPASLALRRDAAEALGNAAEARTYAARLAALGQVKDPRQLTTQEAP